MFIICFVSILVAALVTLVLLAVIGIFEKLAYSRAHCQTCMDLLEYGRLESINSQEQLLILKLLDYTDRKHEERERKGIWNG